ncbi:MAG: hypothetical protein WCQ89_00135 [Verrucomicrobiota bacterium]
MNAWLRHSVIFLLSGLMIFAAGLVHEESVLIFGARKISFVPPDGFTVAKGRDNAGEIALRLSDAKERHSLEIAFLPDAEARQTSPRARREMMNDLFREYVGSSQEKGMQFEELEPRAGAGTYCVFTDVSLIGKAEVPAGEFLHLTAGLKAWPGVVVVFRLFSNDTDSPEYRALMKTLRESLLEKPVPMR